jgi:hypothetical protein
MTMMMISLWMRQLGIRPLPRNRIFRISTDLTDTHLRQASMSHKPLKPRACHQILYIHLTNHQRLTFSRVSLHTMRLLLPRISHHSRRRSLKRTGQRALQSAPSKATSLHMIFRKIWRVLGGPLSRLSLLALSHLPATSHLLVLSLPQQASRQLGACHHLLLGPVVYHHLGRLRYHRLQWVLLRRQQQPLPPRRTSSKSFPCLRRGLNLDLRVQEGTPLTLARHRRPSRPQAMHLLHRQRTLMPASPLTPAQR